MKVQTQSTIRPEKYSIENVEGSKCTVLFFDNIEEKQDEEKNIIYIYDMYDVEMTYREDLKEKIKLEFDKYLEDAKTKAYNEAAKQVREKRNKLLEETDQFMCLDRMNIDISNTDEITTVTVIKIAVTFFKSIFKILKGNYAKYRQELRDITTQSGFPYNVEFPQEPNTNDESEE